MFTRACLGLLLLLSPYAMCQVDTETATTQAAQSPMTTPPPVSGAAYSTAFTSEAESNFLRAGLTLSTAYSDNVQGGSGGPVSDMSYSLWPTIAFDSTTTRLHWVLNYSPGFTFYQRMSNLNQSDQNVRLDFQYQLSPHVTATLRDSFQKTSNPFNQPNPLLATPVSGSAPTSTVGIIAPGANQLQNVASAQVTYQFRENAMIGAGGNFGNLFYPNPAEVTGLFNSNSDGFSAFYSYRIREKYDIGLSYQYSYVLAYQTGGAPNSTQTQTQTIFFFATIHLKPTLSLSLSGGPQHYEATQSTLPASGSWSPMAMASLSWQGQRTSLAASYSQIVSSGGGLAGAYHSNVANVSGAWQMNRNWTIAASGGYSLSNTLTPWFLGTSSGGHTISATLFAQRPLGEHLNIQAGYNRVQQAYSGISSISAAPDTNREFVSISYQFARPLKR